MDFTPIHDKEDVVNFSRLRSLFDNRRLRLLSIEELADELHLKPKTIKNWVAQRRLPFIRVGGKPLFEEQEVMAWLKRKEIKPCR